MLILRRIPAYIACEVFHCMKLKLEKPKIPSTNTKILYSKPTLKLYFNHLILFCQCLIPLKIKNSFSHHSQSTPPLNFGTFTNELDWKESSKHNKVADMLTFHHQFPIFVLLIPLAIFFCYSSTIYFTVPLSATQSTSLIASNIKINTFVL